MRTGAFVTSEEKQAPVLHDLFASQVTRTPEAVALSMEGEGEITYAGLDRQADAVARSLLGAGVAPRSRVALLARTGFSHVIGILAALKRGAAFATINADEPTARQRQIIDMLEPSAVLFDPALRDSANRLAGPHPLIPITGYGDAGPSDSPPEVITVSPADTAFIAFTSGSTGRPKGIVQSHRSFAQFIEWYGRAFGYNTGTRAAQWAAPTYDAAYTEILAGLISGATVCLVPRAARNDPAAFLQWAEDSRIDVLQTVPSYATQLLKQMRATNTGAWKDLQYLLLAGEELTIPLASGLNELLPAGAELYNLYGPSECVLATYHRVIPEDFDAKSITIGRAIDGRKLVVLDETGAECRPGITGEICVRSRFLADGYLKDDAQTESVFIDRHAGDADPETRELHTGDLGRWRASGDLEWLGRRDNMVKRRGVRIELEEVERKLRDLPEVTECAVTTVQRDNPYGETVLVGHVVLADQAGLASDADGPAYIRRRATSVLPTQMIPDVLETVRGLPRLSNGKLDRNALASMALRKPERPGPHADDLTPIEEQIIHIFSDVLGVTSIRATDDFFYLGGHSLLGMTVLDRIRVSTGVDLPMLAIFERPTACQLAALVEETREREPAGAQPSPGTPPAYALTPGQAAIWVADRLLPGNPAYNIPLITAIRGVIDTGILEQSLRRVIGRHDILRARYVFNGDAPVHVIERDMPHRLRIVDLSDCPRGEKSAAVESAVRDVINAPFDLEAGSLVRAAVISLDRDNHVLVLALHHIICDEGSLHVLADEISVLYETALLGGAVPASPAVQFDQFVTRYSQPDTADNDGPSPGNASPGQLRRAASGIPANRVQNVLGPRQAAAIRAVASETGATLFTTLLTCFGATLRSLDPEPDTLTVDIPLSLRREAFSRSIGCFVETGRVSFASRPDGTFRQLLSDAHAQLATFGGRDPGGGPAPDARALFTLHRGAVPFVRLAGLKCASYPLDRNTAKYGLGFYWRDDAATLSYVVEYATDLYTSSAIDKLIACYVDVIDQACADPNSPLARPGSDT
jgi:amino acid adenylation domain-containing protein